MHGLHPTLFYLVRNIIIVNVLKTGTHQNERALKKRGEKKSCQVKVIVIEMYIDFDKSKTDHEVDVFNFAC